ncbi:MAG: energy-coupling factor transporter transmembrane protein EcfT [Coriobacteriales bacterium]|nr:energy-coupling factor transporter transmembrane protein EcfT [Coriobacteriales bacterium]MBQ6586009.1 energy-coupling factor transporter transmembrane protein EcfT [Coriobacteriales bacterium]
MAFQVPFGQYVARESALHRMDARAKLALLATYIFALFAFKSWYAMAALVALMLLAYGLGHIKASLAARALKPLILILLFTILVNGLTFRADSIPGAVALIRNFGIKPDGMLLGCFYALRICLLIFATSLLTFTTKPVALTDALTSILGPLRVLHVPVDDMATMFSIVLRFIPITAAQIDQVMTAQRARGANFDDGPLMQRLRALVPVLVPVFVGLFRRADDLACAMESRCYTGQGRTRLNVPVMRPVDKLVCALCLLACAALITMLILR